VDFKKQSPCSIVPGPFERECTILRFAGNALIAHYYGAPISP